MLQSIHQIIDSSYVIAATSMACHLQRDSCAAVELPAAVGGRRLHAAATAAGEPDGAGQGEVGRRGAVAVVTDELLLVEEREGCGGEGTTGFTL
jgi:hypothetical protein